MLPKRENESDKLSNGTLGESAAAAAAVDSFAYINMRLNNEKNTTSPSAKAEQDSLLNSSLTATKRTFSKQQRRFDSIAWLIEGDQKCGAAAFDGENLLIAINKNINQKQYLCNASLKYIKKIANIYFKLREEFGISVDTSTFEPERRKQWKKQMKKCKKAKRKLKDFAKKNVNAYEKETFNQQNIDTYKKNFDRSLDKLTESIMRTYLDPSNEKALDIGVAEAIRNGEIEFLTGASLSASSSTIQEGKQLDIHAELKIIGRIASRNNRISSNEIYIGISDKCCLKCAMLIQAINEMGGIKKRDGQSGNILILKRDDEGHGHDYPSEPPAFLMQPEYTEVKNRFIQLMQSNEDYAEINDPRKIFNPRGRIDNSAKPAKKTQDISATKASKSESFSSEDSSSSNSSSFGPQPTRKKSSKQGARHFSNYKRGEGKKEKDQYQSRRGYGYK